MEVAYRMKVVLLVRFLVESVEIQEVIEKQEEVGLGALPRIINTACGLIRDEEDKEPHILEEQEEEEPRGIPLQMDQIMVVQEEMQGYVGKMELFGTRWWRWEPRRVWCL